MHPDEALVINETANISTEAWDALEAKTREADDEFVRTMSTRLFDGIPIPKDWRTGP